MTAHAAAHSGQGVGWDAIVVGGRVAGASTALLLARAGWRVLVVDRARRGADTLSTHALMRGGVLQLQRWGLLEKVAAAGTPPVRRVTFHYGADCLPVSLKPNSGVDALYAPRRTLLDALLVSAAEDAGARFRFRVSMTDLTFDGTGRVDGVVLRDRFGATRIERAPLVVGADGRSSIVAERVGAPTIAAGANTAAFAYGYWPATDLDGYHWYYGDALSAGVIPTNDGLACIFVGGPPTVLQAAMRDRRPDEAQRGLLGRINDGLVDLTAAPPAGSVRFFRGTPSLLRRPYGPGWALVGDAGCWKDPLSTHGITAALHDAELLTAAVGGLDPDAASDLALSDYQTQRDRTAAQLHPIADRLASHQWSMTEVRRLLHGMASVMADEVEAIRELDSLPAPTA
jgi:2-polyprenyl-6-methoxyphenol hydroxylase-like FAD-dependent oxidoreductase